MLYTDDQFETITARDLLERPHSWISGNAYQSKKHVAHEVQFAFWHEQFIRFSYKVREGVQYSGSSGASKDVIELVNFGEHPYAIIVGDRAPSTQMMVLKREFEPVREEEKTDDE